MEILIPRLKAGDSLDVFPEDFPTVEREQAVAYLRMIFETWLRDDAHTA